MIIHTRHSGYSSDGIRLYNIPGLFEQDAPDTSGMNAAAVANASLSKEALDWYKQIYADTAPDRTKAAAMNEKVSNAQLEALNTNTALSNDYANYAKTTFRPMEQAIVADAQAFNTPERVNQAVDKAQADVNAGFSNAQSQNQRAMSRMGINPSSGRAAALNNQTAMAQAAALAGAANKARTDTETLGYARKMDAANLGRNLASNQATSAGVALNAGNSAVSNAGQTLNQTNAATSTFGNMFSTAGNLNQSSANIYGNIANIENTANANNNAWMGAVGQGVGAYFGAKSDERAKKNIKPVSDDQALKQVEKTPVSTWDYKPGEGDGGHHTGPMAQQVKATMGEQAAPGGTKIDLITLNGKNMAAIAALSRKVDKLSKRVKGAKA